jgi:hypothetical protein
MPENCVLNDVIVDPATTSLIWSTALITGLVITIVHATRWFLAPVRGAVTELVVFVLALTGVVLFLRDIQACKVQAAMGKLLIFLILANGLVPWAFHHEVSNDVYEREDEAEHS